MNDANISENYSSFLRACRSARHAICVFLFSGLSACGSGNDGIGGGIVITSSMPASATTYSRGVPVNGSSTTFSQQITDNSGNTINYTTTENTTSVSSDTSHTEQITPSGGSIVNGTEYGVTGYTTSYDASDSLQFEDFIYEGTNASCTYIPSAAVLPFPLYVGETWTSSWKESCTTGYSGNVSLTNGTVVDIESITVPEGTFNALKIQYQITATSPANGFVKTQFVTEWRSTDFCNLLKAENQFVYSAPPNGANGYAVSSVQELTAVSP